MVLWVGRWYAEGKRKQMAGQLNYCQYEEKNVQTQTIYITVLGCHIKFMMRHLHFLSNKLDFIYRSFQCTHFSYSKVDISIEHHIKYKIMLRCARLLWKLTIWKYYKSLLQRCKKIYSIHGIRQMHEMGRVKNNTEAMGQMGSWNS